MGSEVEEMWGERETFIWNLVARLPEDYRNMLLLVAYRVGSYAGGKMTRSASHTYLRRKKNFYIWLKYIKYYYDNKKQIDAVLREKLISRQTSKQQQYNVFMDLLKNPFRSAGEIGKKHGINDNTVKTIVSRCREKLRKEPIMVPLLDNFDQVVYDKGRKKKAK